MTSRIINTLVLVALLLGLTTSVALACDPRYEYCPTPAYQPPAGGDWARLQYDVGYVGQCAQQGYYQAAWIGEQVWHGVQTYPYNW